MNSIKYGFKLLGEIWGFAKQNRMYWMVPLFAVLATSAFVIGGSQVVAPLIYALF